MTRFFSSFAIDEASVVIRRSGQIDIARLTDLYLSHLHTLAINGDDRASYTLDSLLREGARRAMHSALKVDRVSVRVRATNRIVSITARFGRQLRGSDGKRCKTFQYPLWLDLSWEDFAELIEELLGQMDHLADDVQAMREVLRLRERFPDSKTPFEAMRQAHIDSSAIAIS